MDGPSGGYLLLRNSGVGVGANVLGGPFGLNIFFSLGEGNWESEAPGRGGFSFLLRIPGGGGGSQERGGGGRADRPGGVCSE